MQNLPIAASADAIHQNLFGGHKREFFREMPCDHLRVDDQSLDDIAIQNQNRVDPEKCVALRAATAVGSMA